MSNSAKRKKSRPDGGPRPTRPVPGVRHMVGGPGPTVTAADGTVWRLSLNHQNAKAALEELVRSHAIRTALRDKRRLGGRDGDDHYAAFEELLDGDHYLTMGKGWQAAVRSRDGNWLFLASLLAEHHPTVTPDAVRDLMAAEPEQVRAALKAVAPGFFRHVVAAWLEEKGVPAGQAATAAEQVMVELGPLIEHVLGNGPPPTEPETTEAPEPATD